MGDFLTGLAGWYGVSATESLGGPPVCSLEVRDSLLGVPVERPDEPVPDVWQ